MSKPSSSMVHREDRGLVYSSIQNDGTVIHWCDKCEKIWISKETPESKAKLRARKDRTSTIVADKVMAKMMTDYILDIEESLKAVQETLLSRSESRI